MIVREATLLGAAIALIGCVATAPAAPPSTAPPTVVLPPQSNEAELPPQPPQTASDVLTLGREPFDACYRKARAIDPELMQTFVTFSFAIDSTGKPVTAELQYRHRVADSAKDCMRDAALALAFPASMAGRQTGTLAFKPTP
jgi:hypothetical protein